MKQNLIFFTVIILIAASLILFLNQDAKVNIETSNNIEQPSSDSVITDTPSTIESQSLQHSSTVSDEPFITSKEVNDTKSDQAINAYSDEISQCIISHTFNSSKACEKFESELATANFNGVTNLIVDEIKYLKTINPFKDENQDLNFKTSFYLLGLSDQGPIFLAKLYLPEYDEPLGVHIFLSKDPSSLSGDFKDTLESLDLINDKGNRFDQLDSYFKIEITYSDSGADNPDNEHDKPQEESIKIKNDFFPECEFDYSEIIIDKDGKQILQDNCLTIGEDIYTSVITNNDAICMGSKLNQIGDKLITPESIYTFNCEYSSMYVPGIFKKLENLIEVTVPDYQDFLPYIEKLDNIQSLIFNYNPVVNIEHLANLKTLKHLEILLAEVQKPQYFSHLENLESLVLIGVFIDDYNFIQHFPKLISLSISDKYLEYIPTISNPLKLERLILRNNKITDFSNINLFKNLKYADFSQNNITDISAINFKSFNELTLILNDNNLDCSQLEKIDLGSTILKSDCN